ncbi:hypothetical protein PAXRUDRAFT_821569 [Paxillus rubicundulus Ve08.2h10]|uniref:Uncharacterized protein n=1 Tax=Paxillus rubicundulus Ve08.2h10 TaxID=930991 RepID=A0A0D0ED65_9AGAM|nr:hypothetical protein PAXRUDRAFT_821569 [Paxillus rubicundulus Ve08.2h10]
MSKSPRQLSFPSSSEEFALPSSSTLSSSDDGPANPLFLRFRRPSLLSQSSSSYADKRINSPLSMSFTMFSGRHTSTNGEESESDKERMHTESSPSSSSGNPTPPIVMPTDVEETHGGDTKETSNPSTPPPTRHHSMLENELLSPAVVSLRRLTYSLKPPRILNLLAESRPEENEVKSEAAFQRLIASCSELPIQPRTPRAPSDRGRYPEEVCDEEVQREDTPSDDDDGDVEAIFAFDPQSDMSTTKPCTPAHSMNGDDPSMSIMGSPMTVAMDVDAPLASPSITSTPASVQWRYTPPPTTSAVRSNKRKFDDRYDPYPTAAKRRAVSPSISYLRESLPSLSYPRTPSGRPSLPIPLSIPVPSASSATSSPTVTGYPFPSYPTSRQVGIGSMSVSSSPILRPTIGLASPILRPIPRHRRGADGEERDVEGAGEGVNSLTLS